jgi:hypothetical protein
MLHFRRWVWDVVDAKQWYDTRPDYIAVTIHVIY